MRFDLTDKALLVVYEAVHQCHKGPVTISVGLRFALAYLYATAARHDMEQFKRFAACVTDPMHGETAYMGNYMRAQEARGHLNAFMTLAGRDPSLDTDKRLRDEYERLANVPPARAPDGKDRLN